MKPFNNSSKLGSEGGFALVLTILVVLVVGSLVTGAVMMGGNHVLANRYYERGSELEAVANSGLELARARINGDPGIYPDSGYVTLENGVAVEDGAGDVIPGVKRWLYAGPTGVTTGQYGIFGSIVSVVRDEGGGEVVRRLLISQASFARFAYFTDDEGGNIYFNGDDIFGPLHSNDQIKLTGYHSNFYGEVTTAKTISSPGKGTFHEGYREHVSEIPMPTTADIDRVWAEAQRGGTAFMGDSNGNMNTVSTRIEFVAIDLNGDGDNTDEDEGFFKVYRSTHEGWLSAEWAEDEDLRVSENCGRWHGSVFVPAVDHPYNNLGRSNAVRSGSSRCYLGGDDRLNFDLATGTNVFKPTGDGHGYWIRWTGTIAPGLAGRPDAEYLFPLARRYNPSFRGVVAVSGRTGVSGVVRGRVTVMATDDIVILDDLVYATDPGAGTCQDGVGLFAGDDITLSFNLMNAAQAPWEGKDPRTYDDTGGEFIHGVILARDQFGAGDPGEGFADNEDCEGQRGGRGCIYLTGGIIQRERGVVGIGDYGYWKRYSWDACALTTPPPYFPTTGHFAKGQYYHVDPSNFSVADYYEILTPAN